ncbi:hypothetical protein EIP91_000495 [Steccherinum ochraceum]|uniref:MYND-type domain-containing protein n=1 Tax=Steccherinum ochraceum TaxID=92696 RepID=A0A4V2MXQ1_9APHY|nr:hypothetical protein EIP91_000495 [Steccherinum ochraceum]
MGSRGGFVNKIQPPTGLGFEGIAAKYFGASIPEAPPTPQAIVSIARESLKAHSLAKLPCANADAYKGRFCTNGGTSSCSACRLVAYCSTKCQKEHWSQHKAECMDRIRSADWKPVWIVEGRPPSFTGPPLPRVGRHHLWGNVPAYDILNIASNEQSFDQDFKICLPASGDLRNVILTINALPPDFDRQITIVVNDIDPYIVVRNMVLLSILGSSLDSADAANVALHSWYSACVPSEYLLVTAAIMADYTRSSPKPGRVKFTKNLGSRAVMECNVSDDTMLLMSCMFKSTYTVEDASQELHRVFFDRSRDDLHHRVYGRMEPSHRLAYLEYRRFGLVLPFGASSHLYNMPNRLLFSLDGRWLQDDSVTPLQSWNLPDVVAGGRKHGASRADLFGCLYFYLRDQLQSFAQRIKKFNITFHVSDFDASALAPKLSSGYFQDMGIPPSVRFDRVDVSNIVDVEYIGIPKVLDTWGPLLSSSPSATLVAYFMNWIIRQPGGNVDDADRSIVSAAMKRMYKDGRLPLATPPKQATFKFIKDAVDSLPIFLGLLITYHENSEAFQTYLNSHGMQSALRTNGLKLKTRHGIVPHLLTAPSTHFQCILMMKAGT